MEKDQREIGSRKEKILDSEKRNGEDLETDPEKRNREDLETVPVEQFALPFAKTSPKWEEFEATEIFKRAPQRPHFARMVELMPAACLREEFALSAMQTFLNMSERVFSMGKDFPLSEIDKYTKSFAYAETLGFDVTALRSQINEVIQANALDSRTGLEKEMSDELSKEPKVPNKSLNTPLMKSAQPAKNQRY